MRGDGAWKSETYEATKMSSIQGLPSRGSDVSILITRVHLHPLCELVEFWAKFSQDRAADYLTLANDIQSPGTIFREFEGNPGDQCLAQKDGTWFRARIVAQNGSQYVVFLIDKGMTYSTIPTMLAWGKKEYFYLPPEVEFCVLANVLPLSTDNRWSPRALEFLQSLTGRSVKVHVQNFLMLHRMFVLNIPTISKQMYEMGFARKLSAEMFQDFLLASFKSKSEFTIPAEPVTAISMGTGERLHKKQMYMYPELQTGTVETVVVTEVTSPQRIFCQLKVFSQELKKLSEQLTQCCDGRTASCTIGSEMIGFPCAARGSDGMWYRSVLQQVFPVNKVVEVLNVDCGTKQIVQLENVRPLTSEFFRMPVVTYNCSLHGIIDKGVGWTTSQIEYLRTLLLFKTIIAKFEYQSITEGVYYVTLYGDENSNINNLFGSKESCLLQCEKTLEDYAIRTSGHSRNNPLAPQRKKVGIEDNKKRVRSQLLPVENLPIDSTHVAFVQYVSSPSEFWIQTQNFTKDLDDLMDKMADLYQNDMKADVVQNPTVGLYCAAKAEDGDYYRAILTKISNAKVTVHFVDYGNSEAVDSCCIKSLREEFKKLPQLALKCSLADVTPKGGEWSQEACKLFTKTALDKALNVHVTNKEDGHHFVQLTDPDAQGEKDLAKLLWAAGFADQEERKRPFKGKTSSQFALPSTAQYTRTAVKPQNAVVSDVNARQCAMFKEQMFSIGSILDVNVSYIESPNDFWCQLVQSAGHLKLLMYDLQTHYRNSEYQPVVENACVARHPENGMWYRALIIHKHETPHVDVVFIDYGQTERVSVFDLRKIEKHFLPLPGQAFRCSLFNPVDPTLTNNDWTEEAVDRFHTFVETAANGFVILKCTIYAVMYSEQKILFNIVDLETPFESVCTSLVNLVKSAPPKAPSGPSFRLDTYYYSSHNVKTGTEEKVTVTTVKDVRHFYCQLQRNSDMLETLQLKVASLCEQLQRVNVPPVFGTLCFAKYTDGYWYRGQIKATKPSILVHFVDYGDTVEVDKSDLLPIPKEASDIMAVPVQALLCRLSDIPDDVPQEANYWFQTSSTECEFKALIVARDPDGKLVIELYQGRIQVNTKIKKLFEIEVHTEEPVVWQDSKPVKLTVKPVQKRTNASPTQAFEELDNTEQSTRDTNSFIPKSSQLKNTTDSVEKNTSPTQKSRHNVRENRQLYKPPHQRQLNGTPKCTEPPSENKQNVRDPPVQAKPNKSNIRQQSSSTATESWISNDVPAPKMEKLPKLIDLPPSTITGGMVTDVYISHCSSPLSFHVQLVKDEEDIFSIVDKLNNMETASKSATITEVHPGDLVQAEFTDDNSWYRAVVKEKQDEETVVVEFFDFGNTASVPLSKVTKLDKSFLQHPAYSTHCMLKSAAGLGKDKALESEVSSAFESAIGTIGENKLKCKFIQLSGTVWEVGLEDDGVEVECKIGVESQPDDDTKVSNVKKVPLVSKVADSWSLRFKHQEFHEGQQIDVYITAITDAQIFWCQSADSEELDQISERATEAGDAADSVNLDCLSIGSPCIALFSEDQFWHRGEVLNKSGDEVSLLFVDYGNNCQVKLSDVRLIPPEMVQNPVQAFLCELEGFDSSEGFWEINAQDELSALTADQLLQLTVTKVTKTDGKTKCYVRLECDGQVINESMRKFWKRSASEVVSDKSETSSDTQPFVTVVPIEEPTEAETCDYDTDVPSEGQDESEIVEVLTEALTGTMENEDLIEQSECMVEEDIDQILANDPQVSPENSLASFVTPLEKAQDQMCSTSCSQILEGFDVNISAITTKPSDPSPSDVAFEETVLYCTSEESEDLSYEARLTDKDLDEQDLSVMDSTGTEGLSCLLDDCFLEITDESGFTEPFDSPQKEARLYSDKYLDANQIPESPEMAISKARPASVTTARWVPCLSLSPLGKISPELETPDEHSQGSQQNEDLSVVPSSVLAQDSFDSDLDVETPEGVISGSRVSPSLTSARMVPRLTLSPTVKTCPDDSPDKVFVELEQNEDLLFLPSCDHLSRDSSYKETQSPELIPETTSSSVPKNEGLLPLHTNDDSFQDSPDLEKNGETSEGGAPETPASVTPMKTNEDLVVFPSCDETSIDSTDLVHNIEVQEGVIPKVTSSRSTSGQAMCEEMLLLASNVALPEDAFKSELETESADITVPETMSISSPVIMENESLMNEDLLLSPTSDISSPDSSDLDQTIEEAAPETSFASETSVDEVLLTLHTNYFTPQDSLDLDTESSEVTTVEAATVCVTSPEMCEDVLPVNIALPHDSFDLDQDDKTTEEAAPETSSVSETSVETEEVLLTLPTDYITPQDSIDLDTESSDVTTVEAATVYVTSAEMSEDVLPVNVALPHDSFYEEMDTAVTSDAAVSEKMDQELSLLPSSDVLLQDSEDTEQEFDAEAAGDFCPSSNEGSTSAKADQAFELFTHCEDLMGSGDVAAVESRPYTVIVAEKEEEVSLLELCSDEKVENVSPDASPLRSVTEQEDERPPSVEVPCAQLIVLDDEETEAETEFCTFSSYSHFPQMMELEEHMSSLVEEAMCADEEPADESVSSESLEEALTDSSDDTLTEETLFNDSLEAQLSKVTHLSLIVEDGSALDNSFEE